jgi:O-antigen/teichoic acid export membrane protein
LKKLVKFMSSQYVNSFAWLVTEKGFRIVYSVIIGAMVAQYLGPSDYGLMSYAVALLAFAGNIGKLGFEGILVRELVKGNYPTQALLITSYHCRLIATGALIIAINFFFYQGSEDSYKNLILAVVSLSTLLNSNELFDAIFFARANQSKISRLKIFQCLQAFLSRTLLILFEGELELFVAALVLDAIILNVGRRWIIRDELGDSKKITGFDSQIAKFMTSNSWPLLFSSFAVLAYMKIDSIMLEHFRGIEAVGIYTGGVRFIEALYFFPVMLTNTLFKKIIEAKQIGEQLFREKTLVLVSLSTWLGITLCITILTLGPIMIDVLYGTQYSDSKKVLIIYAFNLIFISQGVATSKWLYTENLQILHSIKTYMGLFVNIGLNLVFIPRYGVIGAAWTSLISQFLSSFLAFAFIPRTFSIFKMQLLAFNPVVIVRFLK